MHVLLSSICNRSNPLPGGSSSRNLSLGKENKEPGRVGFDADDSGALPLFPEQNGPSRISSILIPRKVCLAVVSFENNFLIVPLCEFFVCFVFVHCDISFSQSQKQGELL
jgi:hypothetical protein